MCHRVLSGLSSYTSWLILLIFSKCLERIFNNFIFVNLAISRLTNFITGHGICARLPICFEQVVFDNHIQFFVMVRQSIIELVAMMTFVQEISLGQIKIDD